MAPRFEDLPYRPCVGVMLVNRDGMVFIGQRMPSAGPEHVSGSFSWQMPQGGIDSGEAPRDAAIRELWEETNVRSVSLLAEAPDWYTYDLEPRVARKSFRNRYRGQTQKWFAMRFEGIDSEIDIARPGGGRHKPEFVAWRWESIDKLCGLIVPFKRPVYEKVVSTLGPFVRSA